MTEYNGVRTGLKPCPFCGKVPQLMGDAVSWYAVVHECNDGIWLEYGWFGDEDWAIAAWNRRAE